MKDNDKDEKVYEGCDCIEGEEISEKASEKKDKNVSYKKG